MGQPCGSSGAKGRGLRRNEDDCFAAGRQCEQEAKQNRRSRQSWRHGGGRPWLVTRRRSSFGGRRLSAQSSAPYTPYLTWFGSGVLFGRLWYNAFHGAESTISPSHGACGSAA